MYTHLNGPAIEAKHRLLITKESTRVVRTHKCPQLPISPREPSHWFRKTPTELKRAANSCRQTIHRCFIIIFFFIFFIKAISPRSLPAFALRPAAAAADEYFSFSFVQPGVKNFDNFWRCRKKRANNYSPVYEEKLNSFVYQSNPTLCGRKIEFAGCERGGRNQTVKIEKTRESANAAASATTKKR